MAIRDFTDMEVWRPAQKLAKEVYIITKLFPKDETFGLTSQIRRAAGSVPANIAEGFGGNSSRDQEQFYVIANGSLHELRSHLLLATDLGYLVAETSNLLQTELSRTHQLLNGLLRAHRSSRTSNIGNRSSLA
jgi:four helix bundle protein